MTRIRMVLSPLPALSLIFFAAAVAQAQAPLPDPEKPGAFPVGVTTMSFTDHSRTDPATGGPRTLLTEIWYPATDDAKDLPKNRLSDFFLKNKSPELALLLYAGFGVELGEADTRFQNFAARDARVRDGLFPLLLFSHGNGGLRMQNAFWCEHMASHGYIVMAPDHTGNCAATFVDGALVLFENSGDGRTRSAADRPKDLSFLIDEMGRLNAGNDSRFLGRVDLEKIGAAGHSFGGFTCSWLVNADPRVKAIAPMAGAAPAADRTNYDCPLLLFIAAEDDTLGAGRMEDLRRYYEESKGPRYSVEFKNGGHFSFTEMHQLKPDFGDGVGKGKRVTNGEPLDYTPMETVYRLVNGYTTAFFGRYLRGQADYDTYLAENHLPEELIHRHQP
ncbi:MAG: dienelactone hydrolase family protein [Candidatus Hydrogenedentes bacterium]|nr:dienelactone hydrolase family protein [Candidatus Hydrogenedentota bacterium]